jgi:hypothetical protein
MAPSACRVARRFLQHTADTAIGESWRQKGIAMSFMLRQASEQDAWLDVWRRLVQGAREGVLNADRATLLLFFERTARAWLPGFLRARTVDPAKTNWENEWPSVPPEAPGNVPIVDARRPPQEWHIQALANQLQAILAPFGEPDGQTEGAPGSAGTTAQERAAARARQSTGAGAPLVILMPTQEQWLWQCSSGAERAAAAASRDRGTASLTRLVDL